MNWQFKIDNYNICLCYKYQLPICKKSITEQPDDLNFCIRVYIVCSLLTAHGLIVHGSRAHCSRLIAPIGMIFFIHLQKQCIWKR